MWYIALKSNKRIKQYTQKWLGYTSRGNTKELAKYQKELTEYVDLKRPIEKAIVPHGDGYAWRYLRDGQYTYHHITRPIPQGVFDRYYIQYIYASRTGYRMR